MRKLSNSGSPERSEPRGVIQSRSVQATVQHVPVKEDCTPSQFIGLLDNFSLIFIFIARLAIVQIIIFKYFTDIE